MKTTRYTITALNQQELFVSTTTAPTETMTKNLSGIGAMSRIQVAENGLMGQTLLQLENMAVTLTFHSMKLQENLDSYS